MVPFTLKQKNQNCKYVDMQNLVKMNNPARDESCKLTVQNGFDGVPSLVYICPARKRHYHIQSNLMVGSCTNQCIWSPILMRFMAC